MSAGMTCKEPDVMVSDSKDVSGLNMSESSVERSESMIVLSAAMEAATAMEKQTSF